MKVILVDEDPITIKRLKQILIGFEEIKYVEVFCNPYDALTTVILNPPDVVFLDIEMKKLNGIEFVKIIRNRVPNINIVFVTSEREYAVKAFELNAIDYLLRPVKRERVVKTIERIRQHISNVKYDQIICCFGTLKFKVLGVDGYKSVKINWRTKKAKELFAFLLHHRQSAIRKDMLVDMLWPHVDWNQGISLLYTSIYQIRKMLEKINFNIEIKSTENKYTLILNGVKHDIQEWEQKIDSLPPISQKYISEHLSIIKLYKGDYLSQHDYPWAEVEKERLRSSWLYHVKKVTEYLISKSDYREAIHIYHYVQEVYPEGTESYFNLMKLYNEIGEKKAVVVNYKALEKRMYDDYGLKPPTSIQAWYELWQKENISITSI